MDDPNACYQALREYVSRLEEKFISPFLPATPEMKPQDYEYEVKAYCLLAHGAIEEFFERVALYVVDCCVDGWSTKKRLSLTLVTLAMAHGQRIVLDKDKSKPFRIFDGVRNGLKDAKQAFSNAVKANHGASIPYLNALFVPAGIQLADEAKWSDSLSKLVAARGDFAHGTGAKKIMSPEDAKRYVSDCLDLCEKIKLQAEAQVQETIPQMRGVSAPAGPIQADQQGELA